MHRMPFSRLFHSFQFKDSHAASRTQYNAKLKEWCFEKNVKEKDMKAIVCKELKRKAEDPLKLSSFRVRGKPVPPSKIARYKKSSGKEDETTSFSAGEVLGILHWISSLKKLATPSDISCETPENSTFTPVETPKQPSDQMPSGIVLQNVLDSELMQA